MSPHPRAPRHTVTLAPFAARVRLHRLALAGGLVTLLLGVLLWWLGGAPESFEALVVALDLTVGGTILTAGSLVGRARAGEGRRQVQLEVVQSSSARLAAARTRTDACRAVLEESRRVIAWDHARVHLLEGEDELVPYAIDGRAGAYGQADVAALRTRVGEGLTGWVAEQRVPVLAPDAAAHPRAATVPGTVPVPESLLVVPMCHDDRLVGVVTLAALGTGRFDDEDLRLLAILADQAATAVTGAELLEEMARLTNDLRAIVGMTSALSASLDPHDVADLVAEHLARAAGADGARITEWDEASGRLRTLGLYPPATDRDPVLRSLDATPTMRAVLDEQRIAVVGARDAEAGEAALLRREACGGAIMVPLVAKGRTTGLARLTFRGRAAADPARITLVRTMAHDAAMALDNARSYVTARDRADRDPLTGFYNHRYLHERLGAELVASARTGAPLAVLMLDLDDFKIVNDTFGHQHGDRVLVHVAERIRACLRASDVPARYGGDEFAVVLPDADEAAARTVARRILDELRTAPFGADGDGRLPVGTSIGIATCPGDGRTAADLLRVADGALYVSKDRGGGVAIVGREAAVAGLRSLPPAAVRTVA